LAHERDARRQQDLAGPVRNHRERDARGLADAGAEPSERKRREEMDDVDAQTFDRFDECRLDARGRTQVTPGDPDDLVRQLSVDRFVPLTRRSQDGDVIRVEAETQVGQVRLDTAEFRRKVVGDEEVSQV